MQQLLTHICANYIGVQYSKLITTLHDKPQTLESLVELSEESYKHLIEKLKYLIKLNIVTFEKSKGKVLYSVDQRMVLFFQRIIKYYTYIEENCTKEEARILFYFLEVMTSNFQSFAKKEDIRPEQLQRTKQIFAGLIKAGYLYEDQRAVDLQICQKRPEDIVEEKQVEQKQVVQSEKKDVSTKEKQPKQAKGKKKQPLKLQKTEGPIVETKPNIESGIMSKIFHKGTYFCISLNSILNKIKDQLIAKRLKSKFALDKPLKQIIELINLEKYSYPFDFYNEPPHAPKVNLLKDIQTELLEEYIYLKYGRNSLQVYKTLVDSEYISEKTLLKLTLLEIKPLRSALNLMFVSGIVKSIELKVERANTMVFWVDTQVAKKQYMVFLAKTSVNLDLIIRRSKEEMLREENKGLRCPQFQQKLLKLEANLLQIDDCLIMYSN